jgi:hypothetical protein
VALSVETTCLTVTLFQVPYLETDLFPEDPLISTPNTST